MVVEEEKAADGFRKGSILLSLARQPSHSEIVGILRGPRSLFQNGNYRAYFISWHCHVGSIAASANVSLSAPLAGLPIFLSMPAFNTQTQVHEYPTLQNVTRY